MGKIAGGLQAVAWVKGRKFRKAGGSGVALVTWAEPQILPLTLKVPEAFLGQV